MAAAVSRRSALAGGLAALAAGLTGCVGSPSQPPGGSLTIAAGEPGGLYLAFAELLAAQVSADRLGCTALATEGSLDNLERLRAGTVQLALVLADTAQAALAGGAPVGSPVPLRALGRVYENYLQLVVLADGPVRAVADLAGRTVSLGARGSGAALAGERLLAAADLRVATVHRPLSEAVAALEAGQIDALLWSGGVPTPALADLDRRRGIRLLSPSALLPAMRGAHGRVYESVEVPAGAYRLPPTPGTIGVANLLVCLPSLDEAAAASVVRTLVTRSARLVPEQALGTQFLDVRSLITTQGVPLHLGAVAAYRQLHG